MSQSTAFWNFAALEGLRADARTRIITRDAFSLLMRLVLEARGDDAVCFLNHHDAVATVAAYDLREGDAGDRSVVGRGLQELVDVGFVVLDLGARTLRLNLHHGTLAAAAPPLPGSAPLEVIAAERRPPSASRDRAAARKLKFQFSHRSGPFRGSSIPAETTWESWVVSAEGRAFFATRNEAERPAGTTRNDHGTTPERPRNDSSPHTPLPEETKKNQTDGNGISGAGNDSGTARGNDPGTTRGKTPERPSRTRRTKVPTADTAPLPGTSAEAVYRAIVDDPALRPITGNPGDLAGRLVGGMFPHLDAVTVAVQVRHAGAHAARHPGRYSDGARFLTNWLKTADSDAAVRPKPAAAPVTASSPKDPRIGIQPPAPPSAFEHVSLARALGIKWPGYEPTAETKEQAFQRITGRTIEAARAEVAARRGGSP